jgi:type VI secretion system protein ImpK
LLEVLHACLALGFEGRYRLEERGPAKLAEIRQNVYRVTQSVRGSVEADLSPHWRGVEDRRNAVVRFVPLWVVAAACAVILLGAYILFGAWLGERANGINAQLASVGVEPLYTAAPAAPSPKSSFKKLLARQIEQGLVGVEEREDGTSVITLTVPELFASASENVNVRYGELIATIGTAAERVPGHITVIGHTDDQPVRSLKFQDNYELSRARLAGCQPPADQAEPDGPRGFHRQGRLRASLSARGPARESGAQPARRNRPSPWLTRKDDECVTCSKTVPCSPRSGSCSSR